MPTLFVEMPWSTERVAAITTERLRAERIEPVVLATLPDLDRPEDLPRFPELAA